MKILQINKFFHEEGGTERYFFAVRYLLEENSHQVMDFAMIDLKNKGSDYGQYFVNNVDFEKEYSFFEKVKMAFNIIYSFEAKRKLKALIKSEKPKIAHLHNICHQLSPSIFDVLKRYKIPIVQTLHDYKLICPNYQLFTKGKVCERCKGHKYYNATLYRCLFNSYSRSFGSTLEAYSHHSLRSYQKIDLFIAPSKFMKEKCVQFGINSKRIKYLPHFLDPKDYRPSNRIGDYLVYFGRLSEEKGIYTLLKAIAQADKNIKLKMIGDGLDKKEVKALIKELDLDNVELVGFKQGQELKDLVVNSLAVVVPSIWYENAPFSVYEPMFLGKAVIGSNLGGIPELVREGETGLLFEPDNINDLAKKIKQLVNNPKLAEKMGKQARAIAEKDYSPEAHYQGLLNIYNSLVKNEKA